MADTIIERYSVELAEPGCTPGRGRWGALIIPDRDISAVFPYLNAILTDAQYDHENNVLIFAEDGQRYALRRREIRVAHVEDMAQANAIAAGLAARLNQVWQERESIPPRFAERRLPPVIEIYKLLPRSNCARCGCSTCLAFAAELRAGKAKPELCPTISPAEREKLQAMLSG